MSIFLKVLFLRTTKISGVDLNLSNFNFGNYVALPTLLTQNNQCFKTIRSEKNRNTESLPQCNSLYVVISIKRTFLLSVNNFSYTVLNQTMEIKVSCENFWNPYRFNQEDLNRGLHCLRVIAFIYYQACRNRNIRKRLKYQIYIVTSINLLSKRSNIKLFNYCVRYE